MQAVGAGAGVHREGQHGGAQQVPQGVVQKHTWHITDVVSIMVRSMGPFTDVHLVNGPIDLAIMLTTFPICHVCF